jgi:hypothetical protein
MMGRKARCFTPVPAVTLEELVPDDHFYRHLERVLDRAFERDLVQDCYAPGGRLSVDPVVFFKVRTPHYPHTPSVVDGGKQRIILGVLVTPSEVMENQPMLDLLWRARFRWRLWPHQVTGDTTYGTVENIVAVEQQHLRAYVPLPDFDHRTPFYGKDRFQYDPDQDVYRCPQGRSCGLSASQSSSKPCATKPDRVCAAPVPVASSAPPIPQDE